MAELDVKTETQKKQICRNFVWGTCTKQNQCIFRHELNFEFMKSILQFCHDYQNYKVCNRKDCSYLHASLMEETLFRTTGKIPKVLSERYSALSSSGSRDMSGGETVQQIATFIKESFMAAPPHTMESLLMPPPPPPPPLPGNAPAAQAPQPSSQTTNAAPMYHHDGSIPQNMYTSNVSKPWSLFDATRPPPPFQKTSLKRKTTTMNDAVPSKKGNVSGIFSCNKCAQRDKRVEVLKKEMEEMSKQEELHTIFYNNKLKEHETGKNILKELVTPEMFEMIMAKLEPKQESVNSLHDLNRLVPVLLKYVSLHKINQQNSSSSETSTSLSLTEKLAKSVESKNSRKSNLKSIMDIIKNQTKEKESLSEVIQRLSPGAGANHDYSRLTGTPSTSTHQAAASGGFSGGYQSMAGYHGQYSASNKAYGLNAAQAQYAAYAPLPPPPPPAQPYAHAAPTNAGAVMGAANSASNKAYQYSNGYPPFYSYPSL